MNPGFNLRWLVATENSLRYYKGRCNAVACCNRPLMAIPTKAIKEVTLGCSLPRKGKDEKQQVYMENAFEIHLKADFLDSYLRHDYEQVVMEYPQHQIHNHNHSIENTTMRLATEQSEVKHRNHSIVTPFKSFNGSQVYDQGYSPYRSSFMKDLSVGSKFTLNKHAAQCKVRLPNGDTRPMSVEEVKARYLERGDHSHSTGFGKQAEWFILNKRLIFATRDPAVTVEWVEKLKQLIV